MVGLNPVRGILSTVPQFNNLAAGNKSYGLGGRPAPNVGMTANKAGYGARDAGNANRRNAFLERAKVL